MDERCGGGLCRLVRGREGEVRLRGVAPDPDGGGPGGASPRRVPALRRLETPEPVEGPDPKPLPQALPSAGPGDPGGADPGDRGAGGAEAFRPGGADERPGHAPPGGEGPGGRTAPPRGAPPGDRRCPPEDGTAAEQRGAAGPGPSLRHPRVGGGPLEPGVGHLGDSPSPSAFRHEGLPLPSGGPDKAGRAGGSPSGRGNPGLGLSGPGLRGAHRLLRFPPGIAGV